ncbi:MAG: hypothetical protein WEB33_12090 [Bacteroidota bacterium]
MKALSALTLSVFLLSCSSESSVPPELDQASRSIEWSLKPATLAQSTFPVVLPNGTPKQFVSWYFSTLGAAERPGYDTGDEMEREMTATLGATFVPKGVSIVHSKPDTALGKQIVMKWDDDRGVVILEGYLKADEAPVLAREIELPHVQSANELARLTAQSHLEMGGTFQAF